jgi:hypothetical protein
MIITIFDWDDTLMCTSEITGRGRFANLDFTQISANIASLLRLAKRYGPVFIVTNASREWVYDCIFKHLTAEVEELVNSVGLLSTINSGIASQHPVEMRKTVAFSKMIGMFSKRGKHTLLCLGDCENDRNAANAIREKIGSPTTSSGSFAYVKNIKFVPEPTLEVLLTEQKICLELLPSFYAENTHMDHHLSHVSPNFEDFIENRIVINQKNL